MRHFLTVNDLSTEETWKVLDLAATLKSNREKGEIDISCQSKILAMIFEKDSMRTRISFEAAIAQMGGSAINLGKSDIKMRERESIEDISRVMSRYVDVVMIRTFAHADLERFAQYASIPVINGLSDDFHPCQAMADMQTIRENFADLSKVNVSYVGDGNNVAASLGMLCAKLGVKFKIATPVGYELSLKRFEDQKLDASKISCTNDPVEAVSEADIIYTDVWTSMGQEAEKEKRLKDFAPFQLNSDLMAKAPAQAKVMHCLPAHRGEEITDEVIDSKQSIVFDQAENRLHAQKAVIRFLLDV